MNLITTTTPLLDSTTSAPSFCERHLKAITFVAIAGIALTTIGLVTGNYKLLIPGIVTLILASKMYCDAMNPSSDTPETPPLESSQQREARKTARVVAEVPTRGGSSGGRESLRPLFEFLGIWLSCWR
jgi:hypothetical protein